MSETASKSDNMRARGSNASMAQRRWLVEFVSENPQVIAGKQTQDFTLKDIQKKCEEAALVLNSMPGASKNWKQWRKTWHDLRSRTKTKEAGNRKYRKGTGGGPPKEEPLNAVEKTVLQLIKTAAIEGHCNSESQVKFNFDEDLNSSTHRERAEESINDINIEISGKYVHSKDSNAEFIVINTCSDSFDLPDTDEMKRLTCTPMCETKPIQEKAQVPKNRKTLPKKLDALISTAGAAEAYQKCLEMKLNMKEKYYNEKLKLLREQNDILKLQVEAINKVAVNMPQSCEPT